MNKIINFRDEDHSYWHEQQRFLSVNKLLSNFGFYFDRDYWLVHKGIESGIDNFYKKFFSKGFNFEENKPSPDELIAAFEPELHKKGLCVEELVVGINDSWEESSRLGTLFHNKREDEAYTDGYIINPYTGKKFVTQNKPEVPKGFDNSITLEYLMNLEDGAYAELILFSLEHLIAGQSDETFIETINGVRYVDIGDHKTNKKKPANTKKNGTCFYPIDHLNDNTYIKYQLQVSMYAHLLERLGYVVRYVGFYHYQDYKVETRKVLKLKYLGDECRNILDIRKENI